MQGLNKKIIIHYDEIAIKGKNRSKFEDALLKNIKQLIKVLNINVNVIKNWGFITLVSAKEYDLEKVMNSNKLQYLPGIAYFGLAFSFVKNEDFLQLSSVIAKDLSGTFRVSAKRVDKSFPLTSQDIEKKLGEFILKYNPKLKVSLKNFENEIKVEVLDSEILVYKKIKGQSGLPIPISGRAVSLLSAGFDSPVASYMLMKRGVEVFPLHFHASDKTGQEPLEAVLDLARALSKYQLSIQVALVPVIDIQKYIARNAPEKLRVVLLRRVFNRIANKYAKEVSALAIITGESVGQVASQTLENILVVNNASDLPILRPLAGFNKNEIINISKEIGTFEISSRPCEDTCSLFLPKYPETKSDLNEVLSVESKLNDLSLLEEEAYKQIEIKKI